MEIPLPLLLVLALLLGALLSWFAIRRPDRRRLWMRLLATWGAVISLALLLAPPNLTRTYTLSEAILLTEGYSPDTLRSLLNRIQARPLVYSYGVTADGAEPIQDLTAFHEQNKQVSALHVLGNGLSGEETEFLKSVQLVPHLSVLPRGVVSASWSTEVTLGEAVRVQGLFAAGESGKGKLWFRAAGQNRDSLEISGGQPQRFSFQFTPKTTGQFVYHLRWLDKNDSVQQEAVPVTVKAPRQLKVLLLASAPSFEGRFLKNFLADQGHGVAVRNQVSQGIFQTEYVNLLALNLNRLTLPLLQPFDLLLIDQLALQRLSAGEKQALQTAVEQQGLGVLTSFATSPGKAVPFFGEVVFKPILSKEGKNKPVRWQGQRGGKAELEAPTHYIQPKAGQKPLVWVENDAQAVVVQYRKGMGQVGVSMLPETFVWALEGKDDLYAEYWAHLLTNLAKPLLENKPHVETEGLVAQVNQPLKVVSSAGNLQIQRVADSTEILESFPMAGSSLLPDQKVGKGWLTEAGWYRAFNSPESKTNFYLHPESAWKTYQTHQNQKALKAAATRAGESTGNKTIARQEPFPLWPFFLCVLLCVSFLWLEEKL